MIVSTIAPIRSERAPSAWICSTAAWAELRTASIAAVAVAAAPAPASATSRARAAACTVSAAWAAPAWAALGHVGAGAAQRLDGARLGSAPVATSDTAAAISPLARPASSEVAASCPDAADERPGGAGHLADHLAQPVAHRGQRDAEHVALGARLRAAR